METNDNRTPITGHMRTDPETGRVSVQIFIGPYAPDNSNIYIGSGDTADFALLDAVSYNLRCNFRNLQQAAKEATK